MSTIDYNNPRKAEVNNLVRQENQGGNQMTVCEIAKATNRITGKEMIFGTDGNSRYYLIINGINQKASDNRAVVEGLFNYLSK